MTPQDIAQAIIASFDGNASKKVCEAIIDVLVSSGLSRNEAFEMAEDYDVKVLNYLKSYQPQQQLGFDFSTREKDRLIGKLRKRRNDTSETLFARSISPFIPAMRQAMVGIDDSDFETLCAASLKLAGATEAFALRTIDEGGIDFFGRIPIRNQSDNIPSTLLRTSLLKHDLLLLGQAKRNNLNSSIGRPEIQKFGGQVKECISQYAGYTDPPRMRVPENYYKPGEPCLPIFITTASFSDRVPGSLANGILTINGQELAEFLLAHRIGVIFEAGSYSFVKELFRSWVKEQIPLCTYGKNNKSA
jgi:hypothetical protein